MSLAEVLDTLRHLQIPASGVRRVRQRDGVRRYDYFVEAAEVQESVKRMARMKGWRVRPDCKPADRPSAQRPGPTRRLIANSKLKTVSWNIAGLDRKRLELEHFLSLHKPDVIALQETNRRTLASRRLRLNEYCCMGATDPGGIVTLLLGGSSRVDNSMVGHNPVGAAVVRGRIGVGKSASRAILTWKAWMWRRRDIAGMRVSTSPHSCRKCRAYGRIGLLR